MNPFDAMISHINKKPDQNAMNTATSPKVATVQSILNKYHTHSKNPHVRACPQPT
ncbi:MAG: hypothetical protein IPF93_23575 [Saprospiraceae bacterium]|nr:hypothetical protein [Saprospiraceae bacterium]